jgi:hypothetical protein
MRPATVAAAAGHNAALEVATLAHAARTIAAMTGPTRSPRRLRSRLQAARLPYPDGTGSIATGGSAFAAGAGAGASVATGCFSCLGRTDSRRGSRARSEDEHERPHQRCLAQSVLGNEEHAPFPYGAEAVPMIHVTSVMLMTSRPAGASVDRPRQGARRCARTGLITAFHGRRYQRPVNVATSWSARVAQGCAIVRWRTGANE